MPTDRNHKMMGTWMLLARMARIDKKKELWFVVNGVPIRYSLREHALISGLYCHDFPERYQDRLGDLSFVQKHFKNGKVTQELVEEKFLKMKKPTADRLKMGVLYFLSHVIKGNGKRGKKFGTPVDSFLTKIVSDLDDCLRFPWGRLSFFDNLAEINRMMSLFEEEANTNANLSGFIVPLELLPFEAIPNLMTEFRRDVGEADSRCPRMCKSKFRRSLMKGFTIEEINDALGETKDIQSIIVPTLEERHLVSELGEEDDVIDAVVDSWTKRVVDDGKKICFTKHYKEDIEARKFIEVDKESLPRSARRKKMGKGESSKMQEKGSDMKEVKELVESGMKQVKELVDSGMKQVTEILQGMDKRLTVLEDAVLKKRVPEVVCVEDVEEGGGEDVEEGGGEVVPEKKKRKAA